jgi:hypothetical protein
MNYYPDNVYIPERRLKPRIKCDCPARISGHDENGIKFEEDGRAVNLSRSGVYISLNREIPNGTELSIRLALPTGYLELGTSKLALEGTVTRGELRSETVFGIAVELKKFRFI